jgi:hypothetical protein
MVMTREEVKKKVKGFPVSFSIVLFLLVSVFGVITHETVFEKETKFDDVIYNVISSAATPALTKKMVAITFFGPALLYCHRTL